MASLAQEIADMLHERGLTLGVVESATGGLVSHLMTNVPGCSACYRGAIVSYCNQVKIRVVGVSADDLEKYGAVSPQVAEQMATGGRKVLECDVCIADTGIAGPAGGSAEKPVGLFYFGLADQNGVRTQRCLFHGEREQIKEAAAKAVLTWLRNYLKKLPVTSDQ